MYPATDSYIVDTQGNRQPMVHGAIVKSAELDLVASHHFGEEILKWTPCMETRCAMSTVPGTTIDPIKSVNIMAYKARFPEAFAEYISKYGDEDLPDQYFGGTAGIHPSLIGEYKPRVAKGSSMAEKKAALLNELKRIEAVEAQGHPVDHEPGPDLYEDEEYHVDGTPLAELRGIPKRSLETLNANGVVTIEALANLSDFIIPQLGPANWDGYRAKAKAWLKRNERADGVAYDEIAA
jgi:hypothetical protein